MKLVPMSRLTKEDHGRLSNVIDVMLHNFEKSLKSRPTEELVIKDFNDAKEECIACINNMEELLKKRKYASKEYDDLLDKFTIASRKLSSVGVEHRQYVKVSNLWMILKWMQIKDECTEHIIVYTQTMHHGKMQHITLYDELLSVLLSEEFDIDTIKQDLVDMKIVKEV